TGLSGFPPVEDAAGDRPGGHGGGPAGVEGEVGDDLADLLARDAVVQRAFEMPRQLVGAVHGDERRDGDEAPVALGESRPLPDVAEEHLLAEVDELRRDPADHATGGRYGLCTHGLLLSR